MDQAMMGQMCPCPHHKVVPAMITLIALAFLLKALGVMTSESVAILWPLFLLIAGLTKLSSGMCKCCSAKHM